VNKFFSLRKKTKKRNKVNKHKHKHNSVGGDMTI